MLRFPLSVSSPLGLILLRFLNLQCISQSGSMEAHYRDLKPGRKGYFEQIGAFAAIHSNYRVIPAFAQTYPQIFLAGKICRASRNRFRYNSRKIYLPRYSMN